jgi:DNA invertase Pin-like site-specific DNA recombinase
MPPTPATRIFTDHGVSGSAASRPQLAHRLEARPPRPRQHHVLAVVDELTSRSISFLSLTEGRHTDGLMGKAMLTIVAASTQLERDTMIERTRAGLLAAAANGRKGGRPRKVDYADATKARQRRDTGAPYRCAPRGPPPANVGASKSPSKPPRDSSDSPITRSGAGCSWHRWTT